MAGADERLFLRVVEAGSLKAAAEQLGTDPSTVSRRLAQLEARLGVTLLQRSTRRTTPTDAGARYAEGLRRLVEQEEALEAEVSGASEIPRGRLTITAPVDFGTRFVVPVVEALQRDAPELEIELALASERLDLAERGIDVAIRVGRPRDSSLVARKLGVVPRVLVASRRYLRQRGEPRTAADLEAHEFVFYRRAESIEVISPEGETTTVRLRGRLTVNSMTGVRALVEAGAGFHMGPLWAYEESIAAGRVKVLLPTHGLVAYPLHALYPPSSYVPAKVRAFVDRMAAHVRGEATLAEGATAASLRAVNPRTPRSQGASGARARRRR